MSEQPEHTAVLTSAPSETEAAIVIAALEENGIRASSGEYTSGLRAGAWNWVDILVAEENLDRAKEVLVEVQREYDHIDWSQVDVGQPEEEPEEEE
jgi:hypothetical protein